jgi:uncharacterized protein YecE (DUF72 family)
VTPSNDSSEIHLGTSAFTAAGWEGSFYPKGMRPADFLTCYATKFDTVEIDSTFYRTPSASTVDGWDGNDMTRVFCGSAFEEFDQ